MLCIFEDGLCDDPNCASPSPGAEAGMLHELAHAWMLDHLDDATRQRVLGVSGRSVWNDAGVAWVDRGVEYAAETLAWGLSVEKLPLVRLGRPPCEQLTAVFEVLTGIAPLREQQDCPSG